MVEKYNPQAIEARWQKQWAEDKLYEAHKDPSRPKFYFLTMYPYPSGDLHIGHWYAMAPSDTAARYRRMQGYNVLFPIGFDSFGLPAENAAIKRGIHPWTWTYRNIENMRRQLRSMGAMFDWSCEVITSDPEYYKWNQWFFLKFYELGLTYRTYAPVDWCPNCNTTLAREQVVGENRQCERCGTPVIKKDLNQWLFKITRYADELLDFSKIDWPERVKTMQTNWIGRSEGADIVFKSEQGDDITVFTTRADTVFGATFMVLAPEHPLVDKLTTGDRRAEVDSYVHQARRASEIDRLAVDKEKTGVYIGAYAVNPVNDARIPIYIADYVLMQYGTGAIMGVPAHDWRDFVFALKYGLPILPVIDRPDGLTKSFALAGTMKEGFSDRLQAEGIPFEEREGSLQITIPPEKVNRYVQLAQQFIRQDSWNEVVGIRWVFIFHDDVWEWNSLESEQHILTRCQQLEPGVRDKRTLMEMLWSLEFYRDALYHDQYGTMIHSGEFTGTPGEVARQRVAERLGKPAVTYRLRDWLISRQRYWGTPIPIIYCSECGTVPVPYEDLPVVLPEDAQFLPTGESPLKYHEGFRKVACPQCGGSAEREIDTMDTFVDSSWYQYRYLSPHYNQAPFDPEQGRYWLPVDQYTGGIEHATLHLMYTRFFTKAMRDIGVVDFDEPMTRLYNQGIILGEDSEKMSKSRGNVVSPDDYVNAVGADAVRAYLMFIGPWNEGGPWNSRGIDGVVRFLNRVWNLIVAEREVEGTTLSHPADITTLRRLTHQTIKRVSEDLENFRFNTAIAALMEFNNYLVKAKETAVYGTVAWEEAIENLLLLLAPICPHNTEELWGRTGRPYSIHQQAWPMWDPTIAAEDTFTLVIQVNGKIRDKIDVPVSIGEDEAKAIALASENVRRFTDGQKPTKVIYVPGRLVNVVVR
ncbi:MAG: leucine--tRNA ligase [Chloroflexi bacterium RBG_16_57_9]|nr:MAG: leucine--tRNA ligase [Chloroflexi bacterium RBG_16_57_9]